MDECEYTDTVPLEDTVALESPVAEFRLLDHDGKFEVMDVCEIVQDSEDLVEDYGEKDVVLDSDDEREEQNGSVSMLNGECRHVIRPSLGTDDAELVKRQIVPDGCFRRLVNKVTENSRHNSTRSVGCDDSYHPATNSIISKSQDLNPNPSNVKKRVLDQEDPNLVSEPLTEISTDEKRSPPDKSIAIEKVVSYLKEHEKLSYVKSPEAAESQGEALDFVDHYLAVNVLGSHEDIETKKTNRIKSPPSLRSRGSRSLARRVNVRSTATKPTTFDWTQEPFMQEAPTSLRNTKDSLYEFEGDKSGNFSITRKHDGVDSRMRKVSSLCSNETLTGNILSSNKVDTKSVDTDETAKVGSNSGVGNVYGFIKELDEHYDARKNVGKGEQVSIPPDNFDVGLDTQMAAEAMEALTSEASPMFNACFAHQDSDSTLVYPSSNVNKKSKMIHYVNSKEAFIDWSRKEKRSKCVKMSAVELNKNVCCPKNRLSVSNGQCPHNRIRETKDVINSDVLLKRREIITFHDSVYRKGVRGKKLSCDSFFQDTNSSAKREINKNNAEKCPVVDEYAHNNVARLLVYTRRHQLERKHSRNYINLTSDLSSSSVNTHFCGRQAKIPTDTIQSSKELRKLEYESLSPILNTTGTTKLDASLNGNSGTLQGCMGGDKRKQPSNVFSRSPLISELMRLGYTDLQPDFLPKNFRRRRVMDKVCILFSQNLDVKVLKQQRKIVARLGFSIATCCAEATHFVTDNFVRTKNMLEAIARGKPVVTRSWLESCEQAGYVINERSHILRDDKKEKELGFSMPVSLARARQRPLLKGRKVFITPNVKPSTDLMLCLIEAVHGEAVKDISSAMTKDKTIPDNILFLSSEEDYQICAPFIKKGASIYHSELLLNGIVLQKLEYDRHQLFKEFVAK